jgi:two-component system, cell cycle sensor histidine kinase and response regulator CckA
VSLVRDLSGKPSYSIAVVQDITERKRADEALRESNRRTENILESITDAFVAVDRKWRFTYLNKQALLLLHRAREELLGKNMWEEFPEAVNLPAYREYHRAMESGSAVHFEEFNPSLDIWVEVHAYTSEDGLSIYFRDITERKRAQEQLAYHARLLEDMHDAVLATDERFVLTAWNKGAQEMFGPRRCSAGRPTKRSDAIFGTSFLGTTATSKGPRSFGS